MATEAAIKITIDSKQANQSIGTLQKDLEATRKELDRVIKTYGENSKQADNLRKSIVGLEVEMNKLGAASEEASNSQASLKAQLRQLTNELAGLEPGSARFVELSQRAGELRDRIQDTNMVVNSLAGNTTEKLGKALGSVTQIGVAGFQAVYSSMTLMGFEGEDLQATMTTLMAVMNFSQAIQTLGGLPDAFNNVKAAVLSVIPGLAGATTASGALAAAMNAIPFIAIATAIGFALKALYDYSQQTSKAEKEEEKRQKRLKELRKEQQQDTQNILQNSKGFIVLAEKLKATNKGSEERKTLIKEINTQYGTTLKNLSDEAAFQKQVNVELDNYLKYQKLKYAAQKNEDLMMKNLGRQDTLKTDIKTTKESLKTLDEEIKRRGKPTSSFGEQLLEGLKKKRKEEAAALKQMEKDLAATEKRFDSYGKTLLQTEANIDALSNSGDKYEPPVTQTKEITDETEKYAEVLEKAKLQLERLQNVEEITAKYETERTKDKLKQEESVINAKYGDERQNIINKALQLELDAEEAKFKKEGKTVEEWKKRDKEIRDRVDKEIVEGKATTLTQGELDLLKKLEGYRQEDIDNLKKSYTDKEQIIIAQTQQIATNARLAEIQFNKNTELEDINNLQITEEEKGKKRLEIRRKYANDEIDLLKQQANSEKQVLDLQLQQTLADTSKTNAEKQLAQEDYNSKVEKLQMDLVKNINEINDGVEEVVPTKPEKQAKKLAEIQKYTDKIAEVWGQLSSTISSYQEQQNRQREAQIQEQFDNEKKVLDEQLKNRVITEEQYQYELDRIESDRQKRETDAKKKAFEQQKKLQLVNATIQGTQAVLSAYSSGLATPLIGPATAAVYAGIAAAFAAAQIQQINAQEFTAARGGVVPGMGPGSIDSVPSLLAPGEVVINSTSASMYPNLLSSINEAGGGNRLIPNLPPVSNKQETPSVFVNGNTTNQPIKAYVVETDISETQRRINRIKQSVEF